MKKAVIFFLVCILLVSGVSLAESRHYRLDMVWQVSGQEYPYDADIYTENDIMWIMSSIFPDICLQEPAAGLETDVFSDLLDERIPVIVRECALEWFDYLQPVKEAGLYTGDIFDRAETMEYVAFSWGDLGLLLQRISARFIEAGLPELVSEEELYSMNPNCRFELRMYEGRKYITVNVLKQQDVVMTVSADLSQSEQITVIIGYGLPEKNYYHRISLDTSNGTILTDSIYADDNRLGFRLLEEDALIMTLRLSLNKRSEGETGFSAVIAPGKDDMPPIEFSGVAYAVENGRLLEADAGFVGNNDLSVHMTLNGDRETADIGARTVFNTAGANDDEVTEAMMNAMQETLLMPLIQAMAVLPGGYLQLFLNLGE